MEAQPEALILKKHVDIQYDSQRNIRGALLKKIRSKNRQTSQPWHLYIPNKPPFLVVDALVDHWRLAGVQENDAMVMCSATKCAFTYKRALRGFQRLLGRLDLDTSKYGLHSARRGIATRAMELGCSLDEVKLLRDWRSDAVNVYFDEAQARAAIVEKLC